ncbi:translocation/assembly module TamB domain-containing protein [Paracoccus sp. SCSIO 75233]|uniref:translocation/assembly module TamB domain-containing protein n=1 Tax=Paracoccus sp. SCSIO 75233 TaxID=3017782 RepID=UPI0022F0A3FD|nr:translocation/assembly module TamB domain-containing protein [Paracoccus sp. SCSIO 75233]WBU52935.1 translocation/assembly module TamB domain-containing protein [Paracoccus sp. SCSIO 75233]
MLRKFSIRLAFLLLLPLAALAQDASEDDATVAEIAAEETDDKGFLTRFLQNRLSSAGRSVVIDGFEGALSSRATFARIVISDGEGAWLTLHDGAIQWNRSALLRGQVQIGEMSAALIEVPRGPITEEQEETRAEARSFSLPELPVGIYIDQIDAERVVIGSPILGEDAEITLSGSMTLAGGEGTADVEISRVDGKKGEFTFKGGFDNESRVLNIDLSLDEDPGGIFSRIADIDGQPAVNADIKGSGPLTDFAGDIRLATDGVDRITGTLRSQSAEGPDGAPGNRFDINIGGDIATLLPPDNREFFGDRTSLTATGWRGESGRLEVEALDLDTDALKIDGALSLNDQNAPQMLDLNIDFGEEAGAQTLPVKIPFTEPPVTVLSGDLSLGYNAAEGSGWSLQGWLTQIDRDQARIARLDLDGSGQVVLADGESLENIGGQIGFDAAGISLVSANLQQALGDRIGGSTGFDFTPGDVLRLSEMELAGDAYSLGGALTVDGLSSGITLSTDGLIARYDDLSNLSGLAGRNMSGRAEADISASYGVLTRAFDVEGNIVGTDITVDNDQLDNLLRGDSTIDVSAARTEQGTELRSLEINAQRISLTANGLVTGDSMDLTADFDMPTLSDLDPALEGALAANARISGPNGALQLQLDGQATGLQTGIEAVDNAFAGQSDLTATIAQQENGFMLNALRLSNEQLSLDGSGLVAGRDIDARFDLNVSDLAALGERFAGALVAQAQIDADADGRRVTLTGTADDITLGQNNLDGAFLGQTRFSVEAEQKDDLVNISDIRLNNDQMTATANATMSDSGVNARARLDMESIAALGDGWLGALGADAVFTQGPEGTRNFRVDAVGQDLALGQQSVDSALGGQTDVTLVGQQRPGGALEVTSLEVDNEHLNMNASGQLDEGAIDAQARFAIGDLRALGQGWSGTLNADATVTTDDDGTRQIRVDGSGQDIRLGQAQPDAPATGLTNIAIAAAQTGTGAIRIDRADISNDQMNIAAQGVVGQSQTDALAAIDVRDLASLGLGLQGGLDVDARFTDIEDGKRRLTVTGTGDDLALGQAQADAALSGTTTIDVSAVEQGGNFTIERAELANNQTEVSAQGVIGPDGTDASADLSMSDLSALGLGWSGAVEADATLTDAENGGRGFTLTGTGTDLSLGVGGALTGETRFTATGTQNGGLIELESAQIENPDLSADASGRFGQDQTDLTAQLRADDLSFLGRGLGGAVNADATVRDTARGRAITLDGTARNLRVGNAQGNAALAGETRLAVEAVQSGSRITFERLQVENPQIAAEGEGIIGGGVSRFDLQARSGNLGFLGPQFGGSVQASGQLRDQGGRREFDISGSGTNIATGVAQLDAALAGQTRFAASGAQDGSLIRLDSVSARNGQISATASGVYGPGETDIDAQLSAPDLGFVMPQLSGNVAANARITDQPGGRRITAAATANGLGIGNPQADALLQGPTRAELALQQSNGTILVERLNVQNGQIQVIADGNPAEALNLDARLADLAPLLPGITGSAQATGTISQQPGGTAMDLALTGPGGTRAQVSGVYAGAETDLRVSGVSNAAAANGFLRTRSVEGPVSFDLRMQGEPGLDAITGNLSMENGRLAEPRIGLTVDDLRLNAALARGLIDLNVNGNLNAGGALGVDGSVDLRSGAPVLDLNAQLMDAVIRDPNLYELTANGAVSISGVAADGPLVSGRINIVQAEFRIPSTGLGGTQAIPDNIVHIGDSWQAAATRAKAGLEPYGSLAAQDAELAGPAATPPANPARFDLTISAPNQVFVRGRGVDAEMGGELRVTGNARTPVPVGHLSLIRGRVDLLGKRFELSEGLIELQGSLVPVLRLVATHREDDITTRIVIDGELREPDITFESDPELPEEEVLSYLLFGQGLDQITPLQAAQLANAMAVLAGRGGIGVVGNIRDAAGLDDLDLTVDDDGSVAVRAGKYLTRNVYTDVELDDDGKTQINLNLDVTDSVTTRGSVASDGESTLGIYFERDY